MIDRETQLYPPVKRLLEAMGYSVKAEVKSCDIVATKGEDIIVVELKRQFSLKVVYQAMDRRSITSKVFIAVPRPKNYWAKDTRMMMRMLNELGLGLIAVGFEGAPVAEIVCDPQKVKNINYKRRKSLVKEANGRNLDLNQGGVTGRKLITAYKEASVLALCHMEVYDTLKTRDIKQLGYNEKVRNALKGNAYGWFEKVARGEYAMAEKGVIALELPENKELVEYYRKEVNVNV